MTICKLPDRVLRASDFCEAIVYGHVIHLSVSDMQRPRGSHGFGEHSAQPGHRTTAEGAGVHR